MVIRTRRTYASYDADIRGIGLIARAVDAKFVLQPGQRSDARITYLWDAGRAVYGTTFDLEMTVREIVDLGNNQVNLGAEYPLRFAGLVDGARLAAVVAALTEAGVVKPTGATVRSGFVEVPVCELQPPFREASQVDKLAERSSGKRNGRAR